MKTKTQKAPKVPEIYRDLTTPTKSQSELYLCQTDAGWFKFDSPSHCTLVKTGIRMAFATLESLSKLSKSDLENLHFRLFTSLPNDKQDRVTTECMIWSKLVKLAQDRTLEGNPINNKASEINGRKSTIGLRHYYHGSGGDAGALPPQAKVCLSLFKDAIGNGDKVTEADLRKFLEQRASELKTKQDPWRIFQYYRPKLIQLRLIRCD